MSNQITKRIRKILEESQEKDTCMLNAMAIHELANITELLLIRIQKLEKEVKSLKTTNKT